MHVKNCDLYDEALEALKDLCLGPSENIAIAEAIRPNLAKTSIRVLDVGTGDGTACIKIGTTLARHNFSTKILGIDVRKQDKAPSAAANVLYEFLCVDYKNLQTKDLYDIILFRQSIYYLGSFEEIAAQCRSMLSPGGIVVVVCWDKECIFRRIVDLVDSANPALAVCAESIQHAAAKQNFMTVSNYPFRAQVNLTRARAEPHSLLLPLEVLLRGRHVLPIEYEPLEAFLRQDCGELDYRRNSIIILKDNA